MATHKVTMRQPTEIEVNADVEFVIRENGR
jgi:hypothetical protein